MDEQDHRQLLRNNERIVVVKWDWAQTPDICLVSRQAYNVPHPFSVETQDELHDQKRSGYPID